MATPKHLQLGSTTPDPYDNAEYLGLVAIALPGLVAGVHGHLETWQTTFLLAFALGYLVNIVKIPWAILHAAHTRRVREAIPLPRKLQQTDPHAAATRRAASKQLAIIEFFAFLGVIGSPLAGGYILWQLRQATADSRRYVDPVAVKLFVYAASIKPFKYAMGRLRAGSPFRTVEVRYADPELAALDQEVRQLQEDLVVLDTMLARRDEVTFLHDEAKEPLTLLDKAVRSHEHKSTATLVSSTETFSRLEQQVSEIHVRLAANSTLTMALEREADEYRSSRYAALLQWANAGLQAFGAGLQNMGSKLEARPEPRMIGDRRRRADSRARSDSMGTTTSEEY